MLESIRDDGHCKFTVIGIITCKTDAVHANGTFFDRYVSLVLIVGESEYPAPVFIQEKVAVANVFAA